MRLIGVLLMVLCPLAGGVLAPFAVCALPILSDTIVCGHNSWILFPVGVVVGLVAGVVVRLRWFAD